jgi:hypothetical protein
VFGYFGGDPNSEAKLTFGLRSSSTEKPLKKKRSLFGLFKRKKAQDEGAIALQEKKINCRTDSY